MWHVLRAIQAQKLDCSLISIRLQLHQVASAYLVTLSMFLFATTLIFPAHLYNLISDIFDDDGRRHGEEASGNGA